MDNTNSYEYGPKHICLGKPDRTMYGICPYCKSKLELTQHCYESDNMKCQRCNKTFKQDHDGVNYFLHDTTNGSKMKE